MKAGHAHAKRRDARFVNHAVLWQFRFGNELPAITHLVYRFGKRKGRRQGPLTGAATVDSGPAADGGPIVTAADDQWSATQPKQTYTCEVYVVRLAKESA